MYEINPSAHWDEGMLSPVAEINELMLGVLRNRAATTLHSGPRLLCELNALWRSADDAALQRLSRCPFLLLDAGFATPECWQRRNFSSAVMDSAVRPGYFTGADGTALVRHALVFGRYLARTHRLTARVLLALAPECGERLAACSLKELEALAELAPPWIAPRWESQMAVWRQMLQAAIDGHEEGLRRVQLRGLQLMATVW